MRNLNHSLQLPKPRCVILKSDRTILLIFNPKKLQPLCPFIVLSFQEVLTHFIQEVTILGHTGHTVTYSTAFLPLFQKQSFVRENEYKRLFNSFCPECRFFYYLIDYILSNYSYTILGAFIKRSISKINFFNLMSVPIST